MRRCPGVNPHSQEWTGEATVGDAMVALARRLPRARVVVTTRGARGSVLLRRAAKGEEVGGAGAGAAHGVRRKRAGTQPH